MATSQTARSGRKKITLQPFRPDHILVSGDPAGLDVLEAQLKPEGKLRRSLSLGQARSQPLPAQSVKMCVCQTLADAFRPGETDLAGLASAEAVGLELPAEALPLRLFHLRPSRAKRLDPARVANRLRRRVKLDLEIGCDDTLHSPLVSVDSPFGSSDSPFGSSDSPFGSSDSPFGSSDSPFGSSDSPFGSSDSPFAGTPEGVRQVMLHNHAFQRIGVGAISALRPDLQGEGVTIVLLDTLPVNESATPLDPSLIDYYIDLAEEDVPLGRLKPEREVCYTRPPLDPAPGPPPADSIPVAELHKYHGVMVASICRLMAPRATIIGARVLDDHGKGYSTAMIQAIRWAMWHREQGTHLDGKRLVHENVIFNLSMGLPRTQAEVAEACCLLHQVDRACREGALFVCASGNDSHWKPENPVEPAAYGFFADTDNTREQVICAGGTDRETEPAYFSNDAHIAAPSRRITVSLGRRVEGSAPITNLKDPLNPLVVWSGTSFAAPMVSGLAALLLGSGKPVDRVKQHIWRTAKEPEHWRGVREIDLLGAFGC
ncbi:MAG: S8 family serine peptidase [Anaerolineae bacterium]